MGRLQTHGEIREEARLVEALRAGDVAAFRELVARHHSSLVRLATVFVRSLERIELSGIPGRWGRADATSEVKEVVG
jgi:hypothetical protein